MTRTDAAGRPLGFLDPVETTTTITLERPIDGALLIRLDRPDKLNAFDEAMIRELRYTIWQASFDDSIRVILITGNGRAFCSGRDILGLDFENNLPTAQFRAYVRANHELFDDMEAIEKPIVAIVNGIAAGGGVELATSCDFRIASTDASFMLTENQLGVLPASGACSRMIQMIGIGRVKEMIMMARRVPADEAQRIGLVSEVHAPDELMTAALAFAEQLIARAPLAMGMAKHVINMCQNVDTETGRLLERLGQSVLIRTDDMQEGMKAFREKRKPRFTAR